MESESKHLAKSLVKELKTATTDKKKEQLILEALSDSFIDGQITERECWAQLMLKIQYHVLQCPFVNFYNGSINYRVNSITNREEKIAWCEILFQLAEIINKNVEKEVENVPF